MTKSMTIALAGLIIASPILAAPPIAAQKSGILRLCKENPGKLALGVAVGGALLYWLLRRTQVDTHTAAAKNTSIPARCRVTLRSVFQAYLQDPTTAPIECSSSALFADAFTDTRFVQLYTQFEQATRTENKRKAATEIVAYLAS